MIVLSSKDMPRRDFPAMSREELDRRWREALEIYEEIQAQKVEVDRVYLVAANELNKLERLMNKAKKRAALAGR